MASLLSGTHNSQSAEAFSDELARCEAAAKPLDNTDGIVQFCLRALGEYGCVLVYMLSGPSEHSRHEISSTPGQRAEARGRCDAAR